MSNAPMQAYRTLISLELLPQQLPSFRGEAALILEMVMAGIALKASRGDESYRKALDDYIEIKARLNDFQEA